jgi:formate/nitrite transporter FocA (FNT family)
MPAVPLNEPPRVDAVMPPEMAERAEQVGVRKAAMDATSTFVLAVLAGAFIALGAVFANVGSAAAPGGPPYGVARLLAGVVFSLGLILVVVGGAELFTGNNLIVMAWASRKIGARRCCGTGGSFTSATSSARSAPRAWFS